jgi:hypothetical protein
MNGEMKGYGRKRSWPNLRSYHSVFFEGLRKTMKAFSWDIRDLNPGPPKYEAGVLATRSRRSVSITGYCTKLKGEYVTQNLKCSQRMNAIKSYGANSLTLTLTMNRSSEAYQRV